MGYIFALLHCIGFVELLDILFDTIKFIDTAPMVPALWVFICIPLNLIYIKMGII